MKVYQQRDRFETVVFSSEKWYIAYIIPEKNKQVKN